MPIARTEPQQPGLDHSRGTNSTAAAAGGSSVLFSLQDVIRGCRGPEYTCPGETHAISHSVHLARLASGFANCKNCRHNGAAASELKVVAPTGNDSLLGRSLVAGNGIRGVYLNELDRTRAANWGAAFASFLWDRQPRVGREISQVPTRTLDTEGTDSSPSITCPAPTRRGPTVVIGFDERPSSPDIVVGVALGLRRMGCQVIDLGQTTAPCFRFATHHLEAAGGIFVTGAGCDPAWTGFQFTGQAAVPWHDDQSLRTLESRALGVVIRPTRHAGTQRAFDASIPYEAGLWRLFHALRPLQVVCGTATRHLPKLLDSLFARLPCRLTHEPLPVRKRDLSDPHDVDIQRVAAATVTGQQHLGMIVDDDGERCAFVTDRGRLVSIGELARLLTLFELHEHRQARILLEDSLPAEIATSLAAINPACQVERCDIAALPASLLEFNAHLGVTADHRVWFGGDYPACNAIQTLARVLQALSLSDAPMSELLQRAN